MTGRPLLSSARAARRSCTGLVLAAALAAGCAGPSDLQEVALRLGPADFGRAAPQSRTPSVQISDESRPVIERPETIVIVEKSGVPVVNGVARVTADLPPAAQALDERSFELLERRDVTGMTDDIAIASAMLHFMRRDQGWSASRSADGKRVTVEIHEQNPAAGAKLTFRLEATGPVSQSLVSQPFEIPPRARLVLGYGIGKESREGSAAETAFKASLECDGRAEPQVLLDVRIAAGDERAKRWQTEVSDLPARGRICRLHLETSGGAGVPGNGVWAVPEVLARADRAERRRRNLVLISLDTLRADHLSVYGYPRATTPQIDRQLAARGARFLDVSTAYPLTNIAHMSLMTGLYPGSFPRPGSVDLATPVTLLAESLRDAGFTTGAYTEDVGVAAMYGFSYGFDRFVERPLVGEARGVETFLDGARFLRENRDQRFFLFLHTYKVHAPYTYSPRYGELFGDPAEWRGALAPYEVPPEQQPRVDGYDRAIREADDQVADFLAELDRLGLADETFVVVLSDHGEAFGEHGVVGHGFGGQQEQIHIPWIVRGPGIPAGMTIPEPASIVDVAPTVLELMGVEPPVMQGRSLLAALTSGSAPADRALSFSWIDPGAQGLRRGSWKLLENGASTRTLYDLASDPRERRPVEDGARLAPMEQALATAASDDRERRERMTAVAGRNEPGAASERVVESMRALGYVQ